MNFEAIPYADLKKRLNPDQYAHISWHLDENSIVIIVHSLSIELTNLYLNCTKSVKPDELNFTNTEQECELIFQGGFQGRFLDKINRIIASLKMLPFIKTNEIFDWKIKYFRESPKNSYKYILGEDAFLLQFYLISLKPNLS